MIQNDLTKANTAKIMLVFLCNLGREKVTKKTLPKMII